MTTTSKVAFSVNTRVPAARKFLWGVSTSSFQVEGAAHTDGRWDSIWDAYCPQQGRIKNGDSGDIACDHYHRYREDIVLMREIGIDPSPFSISWPRVLPRGRGTADEPGLDFYHRLVDALLGAAIAPWVCLYHWNLPQGDAGGDEQVNDPAQHEAPPAPADAAQIR